MCVKCDEPVPRCELAAHNTNFHAVVECPACGHQCEKRYLTDHQVSKKEDNTVLELLCSCMPYRSRYWLCGNLMKIVEYFEIMNV